MASKEKKTIKPTTVRWATTHVASVGVGSITVPIVFADVTWIGREVLVSWIEPDTKEREL
jgi:hypothetical protein